MQSIQRYAAHNDGKVLLLAHDLVLGTVHFVLCFQHCW